MIPIQYALRRRMMISVNNGLPISDLPLGALINVGTDGGAGTPNYEIADKDNLVSGGVVLVRKDIHSKSIFCSDSNYFYSGGALDNQIKSTIYNQMPQKLRDLMMDTTFSFSTSGKITRKMFALSYTMVGFGNLGGIAEGKALQLYNSNAKRIKKFNGSNDYWWTSSRYDNRHSYLVTNSGSYYKADKKYDQGVVPAFVIPADAVYDPTPNADGSYNLVL